MTHASPSHAQAYLKKANYKLDAAVDAFMRDLSDAAGPRLSPQVKKAAQAQLSAQFDQYKGKYTGLRY